MSVEIVKKASDLVQNIHGSLTKAVEAAAVGGAYDDDWEAAMRYQIELLRIVNDLKYNAANNLRINKVQATP